jgi:hypothetical protein
LEQVVLVEQIMVMALIPLFPTLLRWEEEEVTVEMVVQDRVPVMVMQALV